jgi:lipoate---protein ligase
MLCILSDSYDPYFNLAVEEMLMKKSDKEYFILSINNQSVIIGKHQVANREINTRYVYENEIPVIRRISGGGTVYHDTGNLNFSFISNSETGRQIDFRKYVKPVIDFLSVYGVEAIMQGKNNLCVGGLKISGNSEHVFKNRVLHHGTLLFNSDLTVLSNVLRNEDCCYYSRAVKSISSPVMNINSLLTGIYNTSDLMIKMSDYILNSSAKNEVYILSKNENTEAQLIAETKYHSWEWNWAYGPEYTFKNVFILNGNEYNCKLVVEGGIIKECNIEGSDKVKKAGTRLLGCRHMVSDILELFREENSLFSPEQVYDFF